VVRDAWHRALGLDLSQVPEGEESRARQPRDDAGRVRHGVRRAEGRDAEDDTERILDFAEELFAKYQGTTPGAEGMREALGAQAAKRVAIRFEVVETVTWDHSKLGGVY
jgi:hypothetical protein